jgi:Plasmid replication region DNA-binding N-term
VVAFSNNNDVIIYSVTDLPLIGPPPPDTLTRGYLVRSGMMQVRVNEAATALQSRGLRPTVARIRAALGGGSPNDLAPALKHWREAVFPTLPTSVQGATTASSVGNIPPQVADLTMELWQRATAAAVVELKGGAAARMVADQSEESHALRAQIAALRDQLQRESLAYGELRAQAARHEAMARESQARALDAETRERGLLRDIGSAKQTIAQLNAALDVRPPARPLTKRLRNSPKKTPSATRAPRNLATRRRKPAALRGGPPLHHRAKHRAPRKPK